jgi:hypothetical protein
LNVTISALDENGNPVDWWFVYKVPKLVGTGSGSAAGYEYVYYDPNVGKVVTSPYQLTVDKGALDLTLDAIFNDPSETTGWILYNDELPDEAKSRRRRETTEASDIPRACSRSTRQRRPGSGSFIHGQSTRCRE